MNNKKKNIQRPGTRRLVQLYAALLYNANLKGFIDGHIYSGDLKAVCVPGFNCPVPAQSPVARWAPCRTR